MEENHKRDCVLALDKMQQAAHDFYIAAVKTNKTQFVEFSGLLTEYVQLLRRQFMEGKDILAEDSPLDTPSAMKFGEKLNAIFGESLMKNREVRSAFLMKLFPGAAITFETHDEFVNSIA
jgi:hypothetical protein